MEVLSPSSSRRRGGDSNGYANSPEFEFWMVRNPSFPQPNLLSADELFSGGVLLPLSLLHHQSSTVPLDQNNPPPPQEPPEPSPEPSKSEASSGPKISNAITNSSASTCSKRWKDIFKKNDRRSSGNNGEDENRNKEKDREKEKEKKGSAAINNGVSAAELNINIWPFRRSGSAGNSGSRPRTAATRKVNSAPCSRSNSAGESKSRKWPASPSRGVVHLGRSSPVWQVRRGSGGGSGSSTWSGNGRSSEAAVKNSQKGIRREGNEARRKIPSSSGAGASSGGGGGGSGQKARGLVLNVPICMGYKQHLSCKSDENSAVGVAATTATEGAGGSGGGGRGAGAGEGVRSSNLFNIRGLFTKKLY